MKLLTEIETVTHCVPDLAREVAAWSSLLGYEVIDEGVLSAQLCSAWGTPAEVGRKYALLQPASGVTAIRFIETGERPGYWPPVTWGWNATEILVEDPDQLARDMESSDFTRFGGPADLYAAPKAPRATQTYAPSGAMVYFTRLLPGGSRYGLHGAKVRVDRIFNVVLGGASLPELIDFYSTVMGLRVSEPIPFTMTLAAQACAAPPDTTFPICVAPLRARNSILELDEYPANTTARPRETGCLPGGMSMVGFSTPSLDSFPVALRAAPVVIDEAPYNGRRVGVAAGPAGEWLELLESG